ncbi:SDR family oxidoreductase [Frankia sp. CNm7]|uniref:SDR family oxidoreductase n=1 Tax=Frankia nepalensis TaxID=1836974 RepID=A0A937UUF3_9ACTN|nr:SDR family oxidoreductase [Frankia nepalensis]MBL7497626.1 SDR family oxidoreductase [Frankia nepalensis]MBL7510060.1 SDR family oxidoreductase [Frankia nepalensis]MBL7517530.1 SDR family oxidoreductase [Frankia nepalensis]MBL7631081.1 SDR family oxidoreductase [Frankia nepalensis]
MKILVTGATGDVGRHVVRGLAERGLPVRAFVRDRDRAARALGPGVELATGDLADRGSLRRAMSGADRLFLACGNVPAQVEHECAAIDAAKAAGVTRVVKLSGPAPDLDSPLVFDSWHGAIERHLTGSGLPAVTLRPRTYMTNLLAYAPAIARTGMLFAPAGTAEISFVDPRDVAGVAVECLAAEELEGRAHTLTGPEAITFERVAHELAAAIGRPVRYVHVTDEDARHAMTADGLPPMVADAVVAIFAAQRAGLMATTTRAVREVTGRQPRSITEFVRDHAHMFGSAPAPAPAPR